MVFTLSNISFLTFFEHSTGCMNILSMKIHTIMKEYESNVVYRTAGDSLIPFSQRFGVTIATDKKCQPTYKRYIYVGQRLYIPIGIQAPVVYTVRPGDTLYLIARRYNTTVDSLMALNNLSSTELRIGQQLTIPFIPKQWSMWVPQTSAEAREPTLA